MNSGVYHNDTTNRWVSCITKGGELFYKEFSFFEEAVEAYRTKCVELYGVGGEEHFEE